METDGSKLKDYVLAIQAEMVANKRDPELNDHPDEIMDYYLEGKGAETIDDLEPHELRELEDLMQDNLEK